ncbi:MAG: guanylate kinase [Planctomycetes bacterium]|nr:guanylate kinase [Planctomycetota bacterium]
MTAETHKTPGLLVVLSGPSGVGKSSLIKRLLVEPRFALSVSATTRSPRPGEVDGIDYHFLAKDEFERRIEAGEFLEYAVVHGRHSYGTLRCEVERLVAEGRIVLLDIDVQGSRELAKHGIDCFRLFVSPPDMQALVERLQKRGSENDIEVARRLETARSEMAAQDEYDRIVVNHDLDETTDVVKNLLIEAAELGLPNDTEARNER